MVITHNILLLIFSNTSLDGQKWIKTTPEKKSFRAYHESQKMQCSARVRAKSVFL